MSDKIRFVMDGKIIEVAAVSPTRTVLQYLREDLTRCGTKEGCAEGDCGACTVVLAELNEDQSGLHHKAVNACITLLPTLHGKALITVESLANEKQPAHPVQQAMIDCHAAQCGFCTPGFVMSLYAQYQTGKRLSRTQVDEALSGNLCRCTGYRPIIDAARRMYDYDDASHGEEVATLELLKSLQPKQTLHLQYRTQQDIPQGTQQFFAPADLHELTSLIEQYPHATLLAGGTDVGLWITKQHRKLDCVIYLGAVPELSNIELRPGELVIGAAATLSLVMPQLVQQWPAMSGLFTRFASLPIRNTATLGGNIANGSPIGDAMPPLLALGTWLTLRRGKQSREIALHDFYLDYQKTALQPGEFVEQIHVPLASPGDLFAAYKVSKRFDQDISAVCGGFCLRLSPDGQQIDHAHIAFGGLATTPKRALHCEVELIGQPWNENTLNSATGALDRDFQPISDMRASSAYRHQVSKNLLRRFYLETTGYGKAMNVYTYGR